MQNIELADYAVREYRALCYRVAEAIHSWGKNLLMEKSKKEIVAIKNSIAESKNNRGRAASVKEVYGIEASGIYTSLENSLQMLEEGKLADARKELGDLRKSIEDKVNIASRPRLA